jgi:hypothetical protein
LKDASARKWWGGEKENKDAPLLVSTLALAGVRSIELSGHPAHTTREFDRGYAPSRSKT